MDRDVLLLLIYFRFFVLIAQLGSSGGFKSASWQLNRFQLISVQIMICILLFRFNFKLFVHYAFMRTFKRTLRSVGPERIFSTNRKLTKFPVLLTNVKSVPDPIRHSVPHLLYLQFCIFYQSIWVDEPYIIERR